MIRNKIASKELSAEQVNFKAEADNLVKHAQNLVEEANVFKRKRVRNSYINLKALLVGGTFLAALIYLYKKLTAKKDKATLNSELEEADYEVIIHPEDELVK